VVRRRPPPNSSPAPHRVQIVSLFLCRYARHLLWIITTPGLLYALWFMGGSMSEYFVLAIAFSEIMLVCGLVATLLAESPAARWLLLIYGIFFFCIVIYLLIRRFISEDKAVSQLKKSKEHMRSSFTIAANYTVIVWLMYGSTLPPVYYCNTLCMYPIFWILGDGLDQLDDNSGVIAFSVLDMASKIGFSAIFFRACKKSPNWHKAIVSFSRQKSAQPPSAPIQSQLPPEPAPAASEATAVAPADSAIEFRSPNPRKAKGR
jgi:bacteriorhodopsin